MVKTQQQIEKEAIEKYNRISEKKKLKYLKSRKRHLKAVYILSSSVLAFLGVFGIIIVATFGNGVFKEYVACFSCIFVSMVLLVALIFKLKKPEKELILEEIKNVLANLYKTWSYHMVAKYRPLVKQHSLMYQNIKDLNDRYKFDKKYCREHRYYEFVNSKKQFDNFDFEFWIFSKVEETPQFFESIITIYEENAKKYEEYCREYNELEQYRQETEIEYLDIEYEIFNRIENDIFEESRLPPIEMPKVWLQISYTSPGGRNHYSKIHIYTYYDLINLEENQENYQEQKEEQEYFNQKKKEREIKFRSLERLEKKIEEKEKKLNQKEKEFFEATREHIYTTKKENFEEIEITDKENMSAYEKLKLLRKKFDSGEITYEEYQKLRKELL